MKQDEKILEVIVKKYEQEGNLMGLEDLLIKKYAKKYLRNMLINWLKEATVPLNTPENIADYLSEKVETLWENSFLKGIKDEEK